MINELNKRFSKFTFNVENKSIDQSMISYFVNHGTRQRINNKKIGVGHSIWVLPETSSGSVVQFKSYKGVKKEN